MNTTRLTVMPAAGWRVCGGELFLDGEEVPVHREVVRIGAAAAGLGDADACGALSEADVRRIFFMDRALLKVDLSSSPRVTLGRTA